MKVYLDDVRLAPEGWVRTVTAEATIELLAWNAVDELSLDHDLGTEQTGYDVLCWIEREVRSNAGYLVPQVHVHTANPVARNKMLLAIEAIRDFKREDSD